MARSWRARTESKQVLRNREGARSSDAADAGVQSRLAWNMARRPGVQLAKVGVNHRAEHEMLTTMDATNKQAGGPGVMRTMSRVLVAALLAFGLAACATGAPQEPGGPLTLLPDTVPVGMDPSTGAGGGCVLTDVSFDDDVTVPANATCTFTNVTIDGNLVLSRGASVISSAGVVNGNVLVYPTAEYTATTTVIDGNVQAEGSAAVDLDQVKVGGNVQTEETTSLVVTGGSVDGNIQPDDGGQLTISGRDGQRRRPGLRQHRRRAINDNVIDATCNARTTTRADRGGNAGPRQRRRPVLGADRALTSLH